MASDTVDRIKEKIDIVELVGSRVPLRQAGRNFKGLCPFHNEKTPSFVVFPDSQHFHCFGCGKSGDVITFVMESENLDFPDALKMLAGRAGIELRPASRRDSELNERRNRLIQLNEIAAAYYAGILWTSTIAQPCRDVLDQRGIDRTTAERFQLGFAPDSFDAVKRHLQMQMGAAEEVLVEVGLCSRSESGSTFDRFRNRLMFPIRSRSGKVIGFGARSLGDEVPKYLNSPQTPIFNKSEALYALDKAYPEVRRTRTLVVVEGYMDAIAAHQFGFENVVASMGTALTSGQVSAIRRYVDSVFLALDSDAAGQLATMRAIETMRESFSDKTPRTVTAAKMVRVERTLGAEIRIVILKRGKDPDDIIRTDPTLWSEAIANAVPLVEYVLLTGLSDIEQTPAARAEALREIAVPVLREIGDPVIQSDYIGLTARLLKYSERDVRYAIFRRARSAEQQPHSAERPRAADPERALAAMLIRYPLSQAARQGVLYAIDPNDVHDARHRAIIDEILIHDGDAAAALDVLPDEIRTYALNLGNQIAVRDDLSPGLASIEIRQTIAKLAMLRHDDRMRQAQADYDEARSTGDVEATRVCLQRLTELGRRKSRFVPKESPYFRDLRSEVP